uniref:Uncharacterized protein n=1 Tax=Opuntia streptacantha TaxID=393608 RepID=A0A7C9DBL3_OPUST
MASSIAFIALCARPLWKSFPVTCNFHGIMPPVPMQGCLSAVSIQYKGPSFNLLSRPSFTSASTPTPVIAEFSSFAMKTATTVDFNFGFASPSFLINSATRAT